MVCQGRRFKSFRSDQKSLIKPTVTSCFFVPAIWRWQNEVKHLSLSPKFVILELLLAASYDTKAIQPFTELACTTGTSVSRVM